MLKIVWHLLSAYNENEFNTKNKCYGRTKCITHISHISEEFADDSEYNRRTNIGHFKL